MKPENERYTVAVDFDGVIHSYTSAWHSPEFIPDPPVEGAIQWLCQMAVDNFDIVIHTTRAATAWGRQAVFEYIRKHGFTGPIKDITTEKPSALIYLDDRAWRFEGPGTFPSKEQIHRAIPWNKRQSVPKPDETQRPTVVRVRVYEWRVTRQKDGWTIRFWFESDAAFGGISSKQAHREADRVTLFDSEDWSTKVHTNLVKKLLEDLPNANSVEVCDPEGNGTVGHRDWP